MATMRGADCPDCGALCEIPVDRITVFGGDLSHELWVAFRCPWCRRATTRVVQDTTAAQLVDKGASVDWIDAPAELDEDHYGPPIKWDDVLEFHRNMESPKQGNGLEELEGSE